MLKKNIKFKNMFTGEDETLDAYFRISKVELTRIEAGESKLAEDGKITGGFHKKLEDIRRAGNGGEIMKAVEDIIFLSYGKKSEDGLSLEKSAEISRAFAQSPAYEVLFDELLDPQNGQIEEFLREVLPPEFAKELPKVDRDKPTRRPQAPTNDAQPEPSKPVEALRVDDAAPKPVESEPKEVPAPVRATVEEQHDGPTPEEIRQWREAQARKDGQ